MKTKVVIERAYDCLADRFRVLAGKRMKNGGFSVIAELRSSDTPEQYGEWQKRRELKPKQKHSCDFKFKGKGKKA